MRFYLTCQSCLDQLRSTVDRRSVAMPVVPVAGTSFVEVVLDTAEESSLQQLEDMQRQRFAS